MPQILRMPEVAANTTEAVLSAWAVTEGSAFAAGDPLVSVETEKAIVDVPAEAPGVLVRRLAAEGAVLEAGAPIALLGAVGETVDDVDRALAELGVDGGRRAVAAPDAGPPPDDGRVPNGVAEPPTVAGAVRPVPASPPGVTGQAPRGDRVFASPIARRIARDAGLELAGVPGTGPGGRIRRRDVEGAIAARTGRGPATEPPAPPPPGGDEVLLPMTPLRRGVAARMTDALAVPHAYLAMEVDAAGLERLRAGSAVSLTSLVVGACAQALLRHPTLNGHWTEAGLLAKRRIDVGIAVATDDGLVVPVVRDAGRLSIGGLDRAIADLVARALAGGLRTDDLGGSTFTVDATARPGSNLAMPVINVPEVAVLAPEEPRKRAVVVETPDGDVIAIRPVMNLVLGIDHRANDGAGGAAFLRDVKAWLEAVGPATPID